jgi:centrin-3
MERKDPDNTGRLTFAAFQEVVAEKMAQRDPLDESKRAFAICGDDHTGKISIGESMNDDELQAMIDEADADHGSQISEAEFIAGMNPSQSFYRAMSLQLTTVCK